MVYFVAPGTVEESIWRQLGRKTEVLGSSIDGVADTQMEFSAGRMSQMGAAAAAGDESEEEAPPDQPARRPLQPSGNGVSKAAQRPARKRSGAAAQVSIDPPPSPRAADLADADDFEPASAAQRPARKRATVGVGAAGQGGAAQGGEEGAKAKGRAKRRPRLGAGEVRGAAGPPASVGCASAGRVGQQAG